MQTGTLPRETSPRPDRRPLIDLTGFRTHLRVIWATWLAGVICGSLMSGRELSTLEGTFTFLEYDKLVHFGAYAGLGVLSILAFGRRPGIPLALSMILLGGLIELGQNLSPGRTPDITDALADTLGVFVGIAAGLLVTRRLARRNPPVSG